MSELNYPLRHYTRGFQDKKYRFWGQGRGCRAGGLCKTAKTWLKISFVKGLCLGKRNRVSISDYVRCMMLGDGGSLIQLRMMLAEMDNTLSNILLAEKIIAANETEMFRNVSTRITVGDRNSATITTEEGDKINAGIAC